LHRQVLGKKAIPANQIALIPASLGGHQASLGGHRAAPSSALQYFRYRRRAEERSDVRRAKLEERSDVRRVKLEERSDVRQAKLEERNNLRRTKL
jgi:hypothetical protein